MNLQTPHNKGRNRNTPLYILAGFTAFVYLGFICHRYFTDGLSAAYLIETSDTWIVHPNHPLFPLLPQYIYRLLGGETRELDALGLLNVWSSIAGCLSVFGIIYMLRSARVSVAVTLIGTAIFAFSAGTWYFNVTGNQYSTAILLHVLCLVLCVKLIKSDAEPDTRLKIMLPFLFAFAVAFHEVNIFLLVPIAYTLYVTGKNPTYGVRSALVITVFAILLTALIFTILAVSIGGVDSLPDFINWQKSYVTRPWYWAHGPVDSLTRSFTGAISLHVAEIHSSSGILGDWSGGPVSIISKILQFIILAGILFITIKSLISYFRDETDRRISNLALAVWLPYLIFSFVFTPESTNYRIFYMPGFILFLSCFLEKFSAGGTKLKKLALPALLAVLLLATNFTFKFLPGSNIGNNPLIYEAVRLSATAGPGDLIIYSGAEQDYLRADYAKYFARCDTALLPDVISGIRNNPEFVIDDIGRRFENGNILVIHEDALYSEEDLEFLNNFYGMDIREGELEDFIKTRHAVANVIVINDKQYLIF